VAAFEFVILLLLLLDLTLTMIWLKPRKFFTKKGKIIKVNWLIKSTIDTYYVSISLENYCGGMEHLTSILVRFHLVFNNNSIGSQWPSVKTPVIQLRSQCGSHYT